MLLVFGIGLALAFILPLALPVVGVRAGRRADDLFRNTIENLFQRGTGPLGRRLDGRFSKRIQERGQSD